MANILTKIKRRILRPLYLDVDQDYRNSILLAGAGRSGTTWIADVINYRNEYRLMFEPFHPEKVSASKIFGRRKYLRPESVDETFIKVADNIFSGRIRNFWIDNFNTKLVCKKRLIKAIRANLLLKWIHKNFSDMPIILLIRHPCATAYSHVKFNLRVNLEDFLCQEDLIADFLNPFIREIQKAQLSSDFEKHIFIWCIENHIPLKQFSKNELCIVFYENFCEKPEEEINRLFSFLGKNVDEKVFKTLKKPASLSRSWSAINSGESLIDSWRKHISEEQINRANEILSLFGLNKIYGNSSMPSLENVYSLMRS